MLDHVLAFGHVIVVFLIASRVAPAAPAGAVRPVVRVSPVDASSRTRASAVPNIRSSNQHVGSYRWLRGVARRFLQILKIYDLVAPAGASRNHVLRLNRSR